MLGLLPAFAGVARERPVGADAASGCCGEVEAGTGWPG